MRSPSTFVITLLGFAAVASTNREANELSISKATNTSQTFHLQMKVTHGNILQTYHVGAALSATVFRNSSEDAGATLVLNNTQLQVDGLNFPFSMNTYDMIAGHSRWSEVTFEIGDGTEGFVHQGSSGIVMDRSGFDGWLVCE
ncbi:hypothetical protein BKA61DRAFT_669203 [Leptodontidium sp. MPI-SDFR-AT-0119]|nr:hypothetical protein BKA61DRAFT_669203 [Leptodontidium sp. MPI-SDFR-AT-0119]